MAMNLPSTDKHDRRIERTKHALLDAFLHLFFESGYEAMTVSDIATRAGVGRSTFYEHYKCKEALLAESFQRPLGMVASVVDAVTSRDAESLRFQLEHFWQNRGKSRLLQATKARRAMARILAAMIHERLIARDRTSGARTNKFGASLTAVAIAEFLLGTITAWLGGDVICDAPTFAENLRDLTQRMIATDATAGYCPEQIRAMSS